MVKDDIFIGMPVITRYGQGTVYDYNDTLRMFMVSLVETPEVVFGWFLRREITPDYVKIREQRLNSIL
jgi:hypothetical protein